MIGRGPPRGRGREGLRAPADRRVSGAPADGGLRGTLQDVRVSGRTCDGRARAHSADREGLGALRTGRVRGTPADGEGLGAHSDGGFGAHPRTGGSSGRPADGRVSGDRGRRVFGAHPRTGGSRAHLRTGGSLGRDQGREGSGTPADGRSRYQDGEGLGTPAGRRVPGRTWADGRVFGGAPADGRVSGRTSGQEGLRAHPRLRPRGAPADREGLGTLRTGGSRGALRQEGLFGRPLTWRVFGLPGRREGLATCDWRVSGHTRTEGLCAPRGREGLWATQDGGGSGHTRGRSGPGAHL